MCQRFQNSEIVLEKNGCRKFSGIVTPRICAVPVTASIEPEKSMYSCTV